MAPKKASTATATEPAPQPQSAPKKATVVKKAIVVVKTKAVTKPATKAVAKTAGTAVTKPATKAIVRVVKKAPAEATPAGMTPVELPPAKQEPDEAKERKPKETPTAIFAAEQVICDPSDAARDLYAQSRFGAMLEDGKLQLSLIEALYLLEKNRILVKDLRGRPYDFQRFIKVAKRIEPNFWIRYSVFKDMRNRGYVVKTALKFGADFRVYDRGIKPGEDHARWVLYPIHEGTTLTWHEFSAKVRVAHSTKKRLLIGIVDDEGDVTYYEIRWLRP